MKGIEMICEAYLALGSNIGNRMEHLLEALGRIEKIPGIDIIKKSRIYETEPVGYLEQEFFLNMVIMINTDKKPLALLGELQQIEVAMKRVKEIHWGPRTIDIDILLYGEMVIDLPQLIVPHPRMKERAFVLIPLKELYKSDTVAGGKIDVFIENSSDRTGVRLYSEKRF